MNFEDNNLHVVSYSHPVKIRLPLQELTRHLYSDPDRPRWIPYRTSYYKEDWGFCLTHESLEKLVEGEYDVCIDATLENGSLSYGEYYLPGRKTDEILLFSHVCHPSLANDNLAGICLLAHLASHLRRQVRRYSYRFVWAPGTIGSIAWLATNEDRLDKIKHGLVLGLLGDSGGITFKRSRRGDTEIDRVSEYVVSSECNGGTVLDFSPYGYDERQFCSPGFNLPIGRLTRSTDGGYAEYHSSADNMEVVSPAMLTDSFNVCCRILNILEDNGPFVNLSPQGEPQLGRRGLYRAQGGDELRQRESALLWVLSMSDGSTTVLDIAQRSRLSFDVVSTAVSELVEAGLLGELEGS